MYLQQALSTRNDSNFFMAHRYQRTKLFTKSSSALAEWLPWTVILEREGGDKHEESAVWR